MSSSKVEVPGQAEWVLKATASVTSDFHSKVPYTRKVATTVTSSRSELENLAREHSSSSSQSLSLTVGAEVELASAEATTKFGFTQSSLTNAANETKSTKTTTKKTTSEIGPIDLDPGESVYIFQKELKFSSNSFETTELTWSNTRTPPELDEPVTLKIPVTVISSSYLEKIDVHTYDGHVYSEDFMQVVGHEANKSENVQDLNKGFGGKYAYLEPKWTTDASQAADCIEVKLAGVIFEETSEKNLTNFAEGVEGDDYFRFIEAQNTGESKKIVAAQLWDGQLHRTPDGWDGYSKDLNEGREGRYLYIVYKLCEA